MSIISVASAPVRSSSPIILSKSFNPPSEFFISIPRRFIASAAVWEQIGPGDGREEGYLPYSTSSKRYNPIYFEVTKRKEVLLLDFEDNLMTAFSPELMLEKLEKDSVLLREYESLGKHKQKRRMLEYVQRYNERHPFYLPSGCVD